MNKLYLKRALAFACLSYAANGLAEAPAASTDKCFEAFKAVVDGAPAKDTWAEPILDHLHDELYRFNKIQTADVELIFCRLTSILGVEPNLSQLPETITKTDPLGGTIVLTVSAPTESFATTLGYTAKAEITHNGTTFMTVWWAGNADSSKGYVIQGSNPMESDGNTRLRYAQWDLTTTTQVVKILATQFASTYLGSAAASSTSKTGGDHAIFARLSYDTASKAITAQDIEIRASKSDATTLKCVRTYFTGTLDGTIAGYRPAKGTPEDVTETSTGGASNGSGLGLDGETGLVDSKTTAKDSGTKSPGSALARGTFDYSCADLDGAATASNTFSPFAGGTVSYTKAPTDIFPK